MRDTTRTRRLPLALGVALVIVLALLPLLNLSIPGILPGPTILGPVAERLSQRWPSVEAYMDDFWRGHPAFAAEWTEELEAYIAYDLVPDGDPLRSATSYRTMAEDTVDMNTGTALPEALAALSAPTLFITVPRGLKNEEPGLYAPAHLQRLLAAFPQVRHVRLDDLNHYTVVMSSRGAGMLAPLLRAERV